MEVCVEYSDIFSEMRSSIPRHVAKYQLCIHRLRRPNLNITLTSNNTTSDIYMKVKAEIYREMYSNTTDIVDVIPQLIYDVFMTNKYNQIISMPNSASLSIEDFILTNIDADMSEKEHDIYIVDEFSYQTLMQEKNNKSIVSYLQGKIKQYAACITSKSH